MRDVQKRVCFLTLKEFALMGFFLVFVLCVNAAVIALDLLYPEQPLMYLANQTIHSFGDLVNIYRHPQMLHIFSIPFFRPSGHFLIYQLLTPFLGWHNNQAFIVVNLVFLALSGYLTLKLYVLLFPRFIMGGYLAFSIYLMHPALILSRLIVLHFEFAYVFLAILSLYCFVCFCKKTVVHSVANSTGKTVTLLLQFPSFLLLAAAVFFFLFALTFKEAALMLGPVLACYWAIYLYNPKVTGVWGYALLKNKQSIEIFCLLTVLTVVGAIYVTLPWPSLSHPLGAVITHSQKMAALREFIRIIIGLPQNIFPQAAVYQPQLLWRNIVFPLATSLAVGSLFLSLALSVILLFTRPGLTPYRKSLLFLSLSAVLFLILPVNWAMGLPWHLSLTLWCVSCMLGFGGDYLLYFLLQNKRRAGFCVAVLAFLIGLSTLRVNRENIAVLLAREGYSMAIAHNAIFNPPDLRGKLDADTVIVVEDSILHNSYALGNSGATFFSLGDFDFDGFEKLQDLSFIKYQALYNGNLFKWAYARPDLQEEVYSFDVHDLQKVPDVILYNWLQHYTNIFCLGYDRQAKWHDRTALFKKNLLQEKANRLLELHPYRPLAATLLTGKVLYTQHLLFPDYQICEYTCDQNIQCKGFTYQYANYQNHSVMKCRFYESFRQEDPKFCATCISFVKEGGRSRRTI